MAVSSSQKLQIKEAVSRSSDLKIKRASFRVRFVSKEFLVLTVGCCFLFVTVALASYYATSRPKVSEVRGFNHLMWLQQAKIRDIETSIERLTCKLPEYRQSAACHGYRSTLESLWKDVRWWSSGKTAMFSLWDTDSHWNSDRSKIESEIDRLRKDQMKEKGELTALMFSDDSAAVPDYKDLAE